MSQRRRTRPNGRPPIKASSLPAHQLDLSGPRPLAACPDCGWWSHLGRANVVLAHRSRHEYPDRSTERTYPHRKEYARCEGSGQRLIVDLHPIEWAAKLREAGRHADLFRSSAVHFKAEPPVPVPVHRPVPARRIAAAR